MLEIGQVHPAWNPFPGRAQLALGLGAVNRHTGGVGNRVVITEQQSIGSKAQAGFLFYLAEQGLLVGFPGQGQAAGESQSETIAAVEHEKIVFAPDYRDGATQAAENGEAAIDRDAGSGYHAKDALPPVPGHGRRLLQQGRDGPGGWGE